MKHWHGFQQQFFLVDNRIAYIVKPKIPILGNPWIWRTRFPDFHIEMDLVLLELGFHIAYVDTDRMHGGPDNLELYNQFYQFALNHLHFCPKMTLEAVSRGGLVAYSWGKRNPEKINCIYADTPVCDIKSWPKGSGKYRGSPEDWHLILKEYHLTEEKGLHFHDNPIDNLESLARAKVPLLHLIGVNDRIVPPEENTLILEQRYKALGGDISVLINRIGKEDCEGHHFEIDRPGDIVQFILNHTPEFKGKFNPDQYFPK